MQNRKQRKEIKEYSHVVNAKPEVIYPLLCPVREYDWIDTWNCQMIYSDSGLAEKHCVFTTNDEQTGFATWINTEFSPSDKIAYTIFREDKVLESLEITLTPSGSTTKLNWRRTYILLNENASEELDKLLKMSDMRMSWVMKSLEHYIDSGEMLKLEG